MYLWRWQEQARSGSLLDGKEKETEKWCPSGASMIAVANLYIFLIHSLLAEWSKGREDFQADT
jgi:hypothetical protein